MNERAAGGGTVKDRAEKPAKSRVRFKRSLAVVFALQNPPRNGHPCLRLVALVITAHRGLTPPRFTPCRAHKNDGIEVAPDPVACLNPTRPGPLHVSRAEGGPARQPLPQQRKDLCRLLGRDTQ